MSVSWPIKFGSRVVISQLKRDENLVLITTTATAGTFSTNLSVSECVITLIDLVHL